MFLADVVRVNEGLSPFSQMKTCFFMNDETGAAVLMALAPPGRADRHLVASDESFEITLCSAWVARLVCLGRSDPWSMRVEGR